MPRLAAFVLALGLTWLQSEPAFAGPPTSEGPPHLTLEMVYDSLDGVVQITHAGDERLFLVERGRNGAGGVPVGARILVQDSATSDLEVFLDVSELIGHGAWGEGGLLSVAFHPEYASNGQLFVFYTAADFDSVVARYLRSNTDPDRADPSSASVLLRVDQPFGAHFGGQLAFGHDGYLYISLGDGGPGSDPACRSQDPGLLQGKVLRIDVDSLPPTDPSGLCGFVGSYAAPASNPFTNDPTVCDEIWALGLRNPWRFSFDRDTGHLYLPDVGEDDREELNVQLAGDPGGHNYGWRIMEGGLCFDPDLINPALPACSSSPAACGDASYTPPDLEYDQSEGDCSITGGFVHRGSIAGLVGWYVFGDWCSGRLWAAREEGGLWSRVLLSPAVPAVQAFGEDVSGNTYVTNATRVWRLVQSPDQIFEDGFESQNLDGWSE